MNNKTTVQQLIDHLQQVKDKTRIVWLEIKDHITYEDTPICNGGYTLHLHTEPGILILSELTAEERTEQEQEPDPDPTPYRPIHYGALKPREVTRADSFLTAPIEP